MEPPVARGERQLSAHLEWSLHELSVALPWFCWCAWISVGVRWTLTTPLTRAGILDDLLFTCVAGVSFVLMARATSTTRLLAQLGFAVLLWLSVLVDTIHYLFFGGFIHYEDLVVAGEMGGVVDSIAHLLSTSFILFGILVPAGLLAYAMLRSARSGRMVPTRATWLFVPAVLALAGLHAMASNHVSAAALNNPVALFVRQAVFGVGEDDEYTPEEVRQQMEEHLAETFHIADDVDLGLPGYPLVQTPHERRAPSEPKNVVLILMESVRTLETGQHGLVSMTPTFDRMRRRGIDARQHYAVGHVTVRGELATLCGIQVHIGGAPVYHHYADRRIRCLPEILGELGYETAWISPVTGFYRNKRQFLSAHGVQQFHDMTDAPASLRSPRLGLGPADANIMRYAMEKIDQLEPPFFAEIMTLSNHHPFSYRYGLDRPHRPDEGRDEELYRGYLSGVHYTDHAIGEFLEAARDKPWFHDTVFIIAADHGGRAFPSVLDRPRSPAQEIEVFHRSPLAIFGAGVQPRQIDFVTSQLDIAPTLLELLDVRTTHHFMGSSVLDSRIPEEERFAVISSSNTWSIRQGDRYCYGIGSSCALGGFPSCGDSENVPREQACFQVGRDLLSLQDAGVGPSMRLMSEAEAETLLTRGRRVVRFNDFLLEHDAYYPPD